LAEHYETLWVPEYGRDYCQNLLAEGIPLDGYLWTTEEFIHIARAQQAREDGYARRCNRVLICDTDALATSIWHERYLGTPSEAVRSIAASRSYAIYVLTDCDIPFVQDGLRDGEHVREWMTRRFRQELEARRSRWICVSGAHEQRLEAAVAAIDALPERATHE
jgi:nicotinamide riboside kinase